MKGGVLIIGSLLWDDDQGKHKNVRKDWRNKRLEIKKKIHVFAPIRYGRVSDQTYTMVFSKQTDVENNWGTVYFVPFKSKISSFLGISNQSEYLSHAENISDKKLVKGAQNWCIIGILFNPEFIEARKKVLLEHFTKKLIADKMGELYKEYRIIPENSILTMQGELDFAWPKTVNSKDQLSFNKYDFLLATCTKPNIPIYPTPKILKDALAGDKRNYFHNNISNGITTFQDRDIINSI